MAWSGLVRIQLIAEFQARPKDVSKESMIPSVNFQHVSLDHCVRNIIISIFPIRICFTAHNSYVSSRTQISESSRRSKVGQDVLEAQLHLQRVKNERYENYCNYCILSVISLFLPLFLLTLLAPAGQGIHGYHRLTTHHFPSSQLIFCMSMSFLRTRFF